MIKIGQNPGQILAIGEPMIELSALDWAAGRAAIGFAGDTLNTAVYLARAFEGAATQVAYLTVLGQDEFSDAMIGWMADEGIATEAIIRHPTRLPGLYAIELSEAGERSFRYWRESSAARTLFDDGPSADAALAGADVVYLSGITLAILSETARRALIDACGRARAEGRAVAFDSNYRPRLWETPDAARSAFEAMWAVTSLGFPSADDEELLYPGETPQDTLARIAGLGAGEIVLKRGADGPLLWTGDATRALDAAPATRVVDTTAAGDSFNAGYLHARLSGADAPEAGAAGHALACRVIAHSGAILPRGA